MVVNPTDLKLALARGPLKLAAALFVVGLMVAWPILGAYSAAPILAAVDRKPVAEVEDRTLLLADMSRKAQAQVLAFATALVARGLSDYQAGGWRESSAWVGWTPRGPAKSCCRAWRGSDTPVIV
ncbi:MAG TPA: hypothetical protein VHV82_00025 [Sporichthyaceae bacterium]|nr:hypothetical protein [Sporichthyaceae bacterium]